MESNNCEVTLSGGIGVLESNLRRFGLVRDYDSAVYEMLSTVSYLMHWKKMQNRLGKGIMSS